jgi:tripartite-type tricarboxylate transporter receptor subunit TctC
MLKLIPLLAPVFGIAAHAQQYPTRPVRIVVFVPTGTPAKIGALNAESNRVLAMPDAKEKLSRAGIDAAGGTSEAFAKFIRAEFNKWGPVMKSAGVKAN